MYIHESISGGEYTFTYFFKHENIKYTKTYSSASGRRWKTSVLKRPDPYIYTYILQVFWICFSTSVQAYDNKMQLPYRFTKNCDSLLLTTTLSHLSRFERFYTVLTKNKYIFDTVIVKVFFPTHRSVLRLSAKSVW